MENFPCSNQQSFRSSSTFGEIHPAVPNKSKRFSLSQLGRRDAAERIHHLGVFDGRLGHGCSAQTGSASHESQCFSNQTAIDFSRRNQICSKHSAKAIRCSRRITATSFVIRNTGPGARRVASSVGQSRIDLTPCWICGRPTSDGFSITLFSFQSTSRD
jgi:hypothetical protein